MLSRLKTLVRDRIPSRLQVPIKYWYARARGGYEPEMALLRLLVQPGQRALDIGGNRGLYAYELAGLGVQLDVFEPNPSCSRVLIAWAAKRASVRVHEVALSNREGVATLRVPVDSSGLEHDSSGSLEHLDDASAKSTEVPLRTLDGFGFHDVAFMKVDVEGHEFDLLQGAQRLLETSRPSLLIEVEQRHSPRPIQATFEFLGALGYRGYFLDGSQIRPLAQFEASRDQSMDRFVARDGYINNFIFLHETRTAEGRYREFLQRVGNR